MISPRSYLISRQAVPPQLSSSSQSPSAPVPAGKKKDDRQAKSRSARSDSSDNDPATRTPTKTPTSMAAGRRKDSADRRTSPTPSPPKTTTDLTRPTSSTGPVQIPVKSKSRDPAHSSKHHHRHAGDRKGHPSPSRRPRDVHSPEAIPPAVAALLAVTSIPASKSSRAWRQAYSVPDKRMTVESIIERSQESEQELSLKLARSPLDVLLTAPEELDIDEISVSDSNLGSVLSTRTISLDSVPSLDESFTTEPLSSVDAPHTPSRSRKTQPTRLSPEPLSSPPGQEELHPLSPRSAPQVTVEELDFRVFEGGTDNMNQTSERRLPVRPLKSAFKSNLTASLRALRQAARSFSSLNFSSIPPEDFLTRSILTIDPQVPYTDERRPPPLEDEPTAALRRYLNPPTSARIDQPRSTAPLQQPPDLQSSVKTYTASIQMQTYKVQRSRSAPPSATRIPQAAAAAPGSPPAPEGSHLALRGGEALEWPAPGPRQREMRENSDFIRIAVMEMAMRKRGKLDDQRPGRARWALPPRKVSSKAYEVRDDGVPTRWVAVTY